MNDPKSHVAITYYDLNEPPLIITFNAEQPKSPKYRDLVGMFAGCYLIHGVGSISMLHFGVDVNWNILMFTLVLSQLSWAGLSDSALKSLLTGLKQLRG